MAQPIKNTPMLYGKDAKRFNAQAFSMPPVESRIKERQRIRRSVESLIKFAESQD